MRDDVVHQVRRRLHHAPGPARRAEAASLAAEGQQLVVPAIPAAQPQEAVGQDAALLTQFVDELLHDLNHCVMPQLARRVELQI